ncbi:MAG: glycine--tRNA ligase [Patescibacteria group bacterium]|nr:glycine--tRNA ligase [Patescibacteria group bacterium]
MDKIQKIISLCKQRGFIFPSSEIYNGFGSCYDFGNLGVEMKQNIKKLWWDEMTKKQENIVGIDTSILMSPKIWQASGHLTTGFADELVECKKCHKRFKLDELTEKNKCPDCGENLTEPKKFNLMMKTFIGPVEDKANIAYLRPETCQGIYVNFLNVANSARMRIPFGIAQIGKAFRNEITPGNYIFRLREFEQMEAQFFINPSDKNKTPDDWFEYWKQQRLNWHIDLGIKKENLRAKEIPEKDRAHYAKRQIDIEYKFPFGWKEIEGVHNRGNYDLSNHSKHSSQNLEYFDEKTKEKYIPYIIETSVGVERSMLAFLCEAYTEIQGGRTETTKSIKDIEVMLKLNKKLCPIQIAILPLVKNKQEIIDKAKEIYNSLKIKFNCAYDEQGSVGKRYRRQDEIGTIYCLTIDFQTIEDDTLTIRDRDTMKQERIKIKDLPQILTEKLN